MTVTGLMPLHDLWHPLQRQGARLLAGHPQEDLHRHAQVRGEGSAQCGQATG